MANSPQSGGRGGRPALNREQICLHALDLIDERGLDALSMRALAARMGTRPMSLYRHVADKDDLLDGIVGLLLAAVPPVALDLDWLTAMRRWAIGYRGVLLRHPRAVPLFSRSSLSYRAAGRQAEQALTEIEAGGLSRADAALTLRAVVRFVVGFSLAGGEVDTVAGYDAAALEGAGMPRLAALMAGLAAGGAAAEDLFVISLDALLSGLAQRMAQGPPLEGPERE